MENEKNASRAADDPLSDDVIEDDAPDLNEAYYHGQETPGYAAALDKDVSFLWGYFYKERDSKNTQDGKWTITTTTLRDMILGSDKTANGPEFGLSRHPIAKKKAGPVIVMGTNVEGVRKAAAMDTMFFVSLDIDSGASLDDVLNAVEDLGLFCILHTSFNHGKRGLELKRDVVLRKLGIETEPTLDQIQEYLHQHDKNRYEETFIGAVTIEDARRLTSSGDVIVLDTPPLDKMRLFFPLAEPVVLRDLAPTQAGALKVWEDAITGLATKLLGVNFDTACTDPSRIFYTPRHPAGADFYSAIIRGNPLAFNDIPKVSKDEYLRGRVSGNAFEQAAGDTGRPAPVILGSGLDLTEWHSKVGKSRLMLADLLETYCADKIRQAGGEKSGHVHTECPFEHEHTSEGGTGTMAINCIDNSSEYWTWFCHHDACQGRHKTELLGEAIRAGWFEESLLTSEEFLYPSDDETEDPAQVMREEASSEGAPTVEELIDRIDFDGADVERTIRALYHRLHGRGLDKVEQNRVNRKIKELSGLDLPTLKSFWRDLVKEQHNKDVAQTKMDAMTAAGATRLMVPKNDSSDDMNIAAIEGLKELNREEPRLFHFIDTLAVIRDDSQGRAKIERLDRQGALSNIIHDRAIFHKEVGDGDNKKLIRDYPPKETVAYVWELPKNIIGLPLRGLKTTPFFGRDGGLVFENGYDPASKMVLAMPIDAKLTSAVRRDWSPTNEEVDDAVMLLADIVGDFALDSMSRGELDAALENGNDTPSFATLVAFLVAAIAREMIDGATPAYFMAKPVPGTGASLLSEIITTILLGAPAPSFGLPENNEELGKTLSTILSEGREVAFFDNINHSMDSGDFASVLTKRTHAARIMGQNQKTIEVEVKNLWLMNGNNVTMSGELLRRSVPIFLDTKLAAPTKGRTFKVENIQKHVEERRWELVSAVLTLVQGWIAKGCPEPQNVKPLASFEAWTKVVGGVLESACIRGFLTKLDEWADAATDATDDSLTRLMALFAQHPVGTVFRPSGTDTPTDVNTGQVEPGAVVSVIDLLNTAGDPTNEGEPILLKGWSYKELFDDVSGQIRFVYSNAAQVSKRLRASARVPHIVGEGDNTQTLRLEERKAKKNGARYWVRVEASEPVLPGDLPGESDSPGKS